MMREEDLYLSVSELAVRIKAGKLSPLELTEAYLERSRAIGPKLNAYATITNELAMEEARRAESEIRAGKYRGPLHGIPYAAKDLLAVKGYPTTWGARPYLDQRFDYDATVIKKLREAGAILIGKAAMIELAGGLGYRFATASATGPAKNPWNTGCWTCGSSSGSAAIASAGLAAFAIGTETWGSIICPSAYCGVTGLRPTYGRVSRHGGMALAFSMDKIGVMGRSGDDCAIVLERISGYDPLDPSSVSAPSFLHNAMMSRKPLRIGWLGNAWKDLPKDIESATKQASDLLKAHGAQIEEADLPEGPWEVAANTVIAVEAAAAFENLIESGRVADLSDPLGRIGGYVYQQQPASDYARALRIRAVLQKKMDKLFERFDAIAAPSQPNSATTLDTNLETELSFPDPLGGIGNLCGLPAVSVPCGFDNRTLPVGIQFVGRALDEDKVLAAAKLFQLNSDWHRKQPPIAWRV